LLVGVGVSKVFVECCFDVSNSFNDSWSKIFVGVTNHDVWVVF